MAVDMKAAIARAAITLLMEKRVKKLTVKDIVETCNITRQAFYYHFEDVPDLLRWILERSSEELVQHCLAQPDLESFLRYFIVFSLNVKPLLHQGMQTNYRDDLEHLLTQYICRFFEQVAESIPLYPHCSYPQMKLILRYHSQAIVGLLHSWTDNDTIHMDEIVHDIALLITGKLSADPSSAKNTSNRELPGSPLNHISLLPK